MLVSISPRHECGRMNRACDVASAFRDRHFLGPSRKSIMGFVFSFSLGSCRVCDVVNEKILNLVVNYGEDRLQRLVDRKRKRIDRFQSQTALGLRSIRPMSPLGVLLTRWLDLLEFARRGPSPVFHSRKIESFSLWLFKKSDWMALSIEQLYL